MVEQINVSGTCSYIDFETASTHHHKLVKQINVSKNKNHKVFVLLKPQKIIGNDQIWQVDCMMASLETGLPTLNGYTTATPPNFEWISEAGDSAGVKKWLIMNNWDTTDVFRSVIICE